MPTADPKVLIIFPLPLLEEVTTAASLSGESRSQWIRDACQRRLRAEDEADPMFSSEPFEEDA